MDVTGNTEQLKATSAIIFPNVAILTISELPRIGVNMPTVRTDNLPRVLMVNLGHSWVHSCASSGAAW